MYIYFMYSIFDDFTRSQSYCTSIMGRFHESRIEKDNYIYNIRLHKFSKKNTFK